MRKSEGEGKQERFGSGVFGAHTAIVRVVRMDRWVAKPHTTRPPENLQTHSPLTDSPLTFFLFCFYSLSPSLAYYCKVRGAKKERKRRNGRVAEQVSKSAGKEEGPFLPLLLWVPCFALSLSECVLMARLQKGENDGEG